MRGRLSKISTHVHFEETLQLEVMEESPPAPAEAKKPTGRAKKTKVKTQEEKCEKVAGGATSVKYELAGVVVHMGTLHGGHYVAYVRRGKHCVIIKCYYKCQV
jgi:ubiquitin C-terminal hydrolase